MIGKRLLFIVVLQTLILFAMIGIKQWTLNTGKPILLETQVIDPQSLFSGDYLNLRYAINAIPSKKLADDEPVNTHDILYVVLKKGDPYWEAVALYHKKPEIADDEVVIKGEVTNRTFDKDTFYLKYGIENYFIPEGEGKKLELPNSNDKLSIGVVVDRFGNAGIRAVLVNGKERYVETLFGRGQSPTPTGNNT